MRDELDLTGLWRFLPDPTGEGEAWGWATPACEDRRWREVRVPGSMDRYVKGMEAYEGPGWFRRRLQVPADWRGQALTLHFAGVNYHAKVWLNGHLLGEHADGFLPFAFPVTEQLRWEADNLLVVLADTTRRAGEVPGLERGWRPFGGILREVTLRSTPLLALSEPCLTLADASGTLALTVPVRHGGTTPRALSCRLTLHDPDGAAVLSVASPGFQLAAGATHTWECRAQVPHPTLWSPDSPRRYTARLALLEGEAILDQTQLRVGFRSMVTAGARLLLNGQPIHLLGANRHEDSPHTDMCPDPATVRADLLDLRAMGANFVRLCHYPHHPLELDLCDELGLLVMAEIPLYWWHGPRLGPAANAATLNAAKRQLRRLITRDRHHPAVIFWSVSNECSEEYREVVAGHAELCQLARELDPTRLAVHVSQASSWQNRPAFEADDVICITHYPSVWGWQNPTRDPARSTAVWREQLAILHQRYPSKPILIAEFGHPAIEGVHEGRYSEARQATVLAAEFAGFDAPYVCGATLWCYAHHPWPEDIFVNYITMSPFGVVTRDRRHLPGWAVLQRLFHERQGRPLPVPAATPPAAPAPGRDYGVRMLRPHLRELPDYPMPAGYRIAPMGPHDSARWTDVQRDAEPLITISDMLFEREFGDDPAAIGWRCFLLYDARGLAVGTISAWYSRDFRGQDWGRIHWVAVRPGHQGKGLARAAMSYAMRQLAQWHERAWLATSSSRLAAIRIYLDFGFVPDLQTDADRQVWRDLARQLKHPRLPE